MYVLQISLLINTFCYPIVEFMHGSWVGHRHRVLLRVSWGRNSALYFILAHFKTLRTLLEFQAVITNTIGTPGPQSAWEHDMERRVAASEKLLAEIHEIQT